MKIFVGMTTHNHLCTRKSSRCLAMVWFGRRWVAQRRSYFSFEAYTEAIKSYNHIVRQSSMQGGIGVGRAPRSWESNDLVVLYYCTYDQRMTKLKDTLMNNRKHVESARPTKMIKSRNRWGA